MWEDEDFTPNGFNGKGKVVYDNQRRRITSFEVDVDTNEPIDLNHIVKYYYMDNFDALEEHYGVLKVKIRFNYNLDNNGELEYIDGGLYVEDDPQLQEEVFDYIDIDDLIEYYPNFMQEHPYYSSHLPLIPESENL